MAIIMRMAPIPEINVKASPRKSMEITVATTISVKRTMVEVTGEICLKPFSHR